jgi:hypothetical protein
MIFDKNRFPLLVIMLYGPPVILRVLALSLAVLPGAALAQRLGSLTPAGNPSAVIAAEGVLSREAKARNPAWSWQDNAEDGAEMVAFGRMPLKAWLKTADPAAQLVNRQVANAWVSCDGSYGVSAGAWGGEADRWFAVVWHRQKKGYYKWVLADAGSLSAPATVPDWVTGKVADCPRRQHQDGPPPPTGTLPPLPAAVPAAPAGDSHDGRSTDGSLVWRSTVLPGGARTLSVWIYQDGAMVGVIDRHVPAAGS